MRRVAAGLFCVVTLFSGCRLSDLSFKADERVEITDPAQRATVKLPFELSWTVKDFKVTGEDGTSSDDQGFFAVMLDTSPMPPGQSLKYFARDDESCTSSPGCPDTQYLADRNIFTTESTHFSVETLSDDRPPDRPSAQDTHDITIVLLNGKGERIGESAFRRRVIVDRSEG